MAEDRDTDEVNEFDEQITQPLAFALSLERASTTRLNSGLFRRLAAVLEVSEAALETLIYDSLVWADATPETLEAGDLLAIAGTAEAIASARQLLAQPAEASPP